MNAGLDFLAWRVSFQSDEQALRSAFDQVTNLSAKLERAKSQLLAIASASRSNFEDSVEYQDWAASKAAGAIVDISAPAKQLVTRGPGRCICCGATLGEPHHAACAYARLTRPQAG